MDHSLQVWAGARRVAQITHDAGGDRWSLAYDPAWAADPQAFPLSPALPLRPAAAAQVSAPLKRFLEHLLPEGRALEVAASYNGVTRNNVFGLIRALGAETAGALRFSLAADTAPAADATAAREVSLQELDQRLAQRGQLPLSVWDGRLRMSVAGLQDKLLAYIPQPLADGGRLFLVDGHRLASTHILKPDSGQQRTPHLAVNEHFCMSLARRMGLPAAEVDLLRTPTPVLVVRRFDRAVQGTGDQAVVQRRHIIDACQACDLPVSHKYERQLGNAPAVRHIRDGISFERLFGCAALANNKAATRLTLLRWALLQFLIGNSDAHGKNFSFVVQAGGLLQPGAWYDLVSVQQYDGFDNDLAMAFGDVFVHADISAFALADFATRCGVPRQLLQREGRRLAGLAASAAAQQAQADVYLAPERAFVATLAAYVAQQAQRLSQLVGAAAAIRAGYL